MRERLLSWACLSSCRSRLDQLLTVCGSRGQDYSRDVGAALAGESRRQDWSDVEDCLPHVLAYLVQLPAGARSTKRGYQEWAREHPDAPASSSFDAHGGWERVRGLALDQMTHPLEN